MQNIETRNLSELRQHPLNPTMRNIMDDRYMSLRKKVRRWGQLGLILVDARDRTTILGGNHVSQAMRDEGITTAKVEYRTPKDDAEALELLMLHNEHFARWIEQGLAEQLHKYKDSIDLSEYRIDLGKLTDAKNVLARYGQTDEDKAPAAEGKGISQFGKVYQLGRHRIMCGDSTNFEHIKTLMAGKKAALVVTDPPYGVSYEGNPSGQDWSMIANDDLRGKTLMDFLFKAFENIAQFGIDKMPAYIFYASSTHREFQEALEKAGFTIRQQIIWAKHMVIGNSDYHWTHEPVFYTHIGKERPPFYGDRTNKTVIETAKMSDIAKLSKEALIGLIGAMKEQSTLQHVQKDTQHYQHPTQKPVAIMTPFIKNSSNVEEIVVDMFTGSGSTMIAAHQLDRVFYGMEFDPRYVDVIRKRYSNYIKADQWETATPEIK